MKINYEKLRAAIKHNTQTIRALKADGKRWKAEEMKMDATRLHALAAHLHGRIHLSGKFLCRPNIHLGENRYTCFIKDGMTKEEQAKFIENTMKEFVIEEKPAESLPA